VPNVIRTYEWRWTTRAIIGGSTTPGVRENRYGPSVDHTCEVQASNEAGARRALREALGTRVPSGACHRVVA
jgi:hypothetical protein